MNQKQYHYWKYFTSDFTVGQSNDLIKKWIINEIALCQTISDYSNQMVTLSKLLFDCMRQAEENGTSKTS